MSAWTRYTMTYDDTYSDVVVDVENPTSTETLALCSEINSFWSGADDRLADEDGNVLMAVLKMLCTRALVAEISNPMGAVHEFAVDGREGWPLLDGSSGIRLVRVDCLEFDGDISVASSPIVE